MQNLRDKAYEYIRQQLVVGDLQVGSRMSVQSLASEMGISRQPVSEALRKLEAERVIEQHARRGTVVRQPRSDEVAELYELREVLECYTCSKAATRLSTTDLETMRLLTDQLRSICLELRHNGGKKMTPDQLRKYLSGDMAFHMLIVKNSGNRRLVQVIENLQMFSRIFGSARKGEVRFSDAVITYHFHSRIYRSLRRGDGEMAEQAMRRHIRRSRDDSLTYLIKLEVDEAQGSGPAVGDAVPGEREGVPAAGRGRKSKINAVERRRSNRT